jgi:hypothetical protein
MNCVRGHTEIYVEVSGIHSLWEHVKTFKLAAKSAIHSIANTE